MAYFEKAAVTVQNAIVQPRAISVKSNQIKIFMSTHNKKASVVGTFENTKKHKQFQPLKCLIFCISI